MDELGIKDPELEFSRWLDERERILTMNRELNARPKRTKAREGASESEEGI